MVFLFGGSHAERIEELDDTAEDDQAPNGVESATSATTVSLEQPKNNNETNDKNNNDSTAYEQPVLPSTFPVSPSYLYHKKNNPNPYESYPIQQQPHQQDRTTMSLNNNHNIRNHNNNNGGGSPPAHPKRTSTSPSVSSIVSGRVSPTPSAQVLMDNKEAFANAKQRLEAEVAVFNLLSGRNSQLVKHGSKTDAKTDRSHESKDPAVVSPDASLPYFKGGVTMTATLSEVGGVKGTVMTSPAGGTASLSGGSRTSVPTLPKQSGGRGGGDASSSPESAKSAPLPSVQRAVPPPPSPPSPAGVDEDSQEKTPLSSLVSGRGSVSFAPTPMVGVAASAAGRNDNASNSPPQKSSHSPENGNVPDDQTVSSVYSRISGVATAIGSATGEFISKLTGYYEVDELANPHVGGDQDEVSELRDFSTSPGRRYSRPSHVMFTAPVAKDANTDQADGVQVMQRGGIGGTNGQGERNHEEQAPSQTKTSEQDQQGTVSFLDDEHRDMTYGRRIALRLMQRKWYYDPDKVQAAELKRLQANNDVSMQVARTVAREAGRELPRPEDDPSNGGSVGTPSIPAKPSLEKAWAYFEHVTLPRYMIKNVYSTKEVYSSKTRNWWKTLLCGCGNPGGNNKLDRAEPGESIVPTKLYSPLYTPLSQMGDFGLGVGLYFSTLRALAIIMLLAGLINIPNLMYYSSLDYSGNGQGTLYYLTRGSAICTNQTFVPCPTCQLSNFEKGAESRYGTDAEGLVFAKKNHCMGAEKMQGMINYGTLFFVFVAIYVMNMYQKRMEVKFDEDEQTTQDYSVAVSNPPNDAYDPEEWREFFSNFGDARVACCTITVSNNVLLHTLRDRRDHLRALEMQLPVGESLNNNHVARVAAEMEANRGFSSRLFSMLHPFGLCLDVPALYDRIVVTTAKIRGLAQRKYPVTRVFISFETEEAQRRVLAELSYPKSKVWANDLSAVSDPAYLFRGKHLLQVFEPAEPDSIRWEDLDSTTKSQVISVAVTTFVNIVAVVLVAFIVKVCRDVDALFAAVAIAFFNTVFPIFAKAMTSLEAHPSEGRKQRSLYIKIAVFRWVNTAIVIAITTPFTSTLTEGDQHLIYAVYAIFFAELVTVNALQYIDIGGILQRHYLGPRAPNQERMNMNFRGTPYDLAERYTALTKILFLCFHYCAIFPATLFFTSFSFFLTYFFDRFSLMRSWSPAPQLGKQVADFTRKYFFSGTIVAFAILSSYAYTGFPYDNLCDTGETVPAQYVGNRTVFPSSEGGSALTEKFIPGQEVSNEVVSISSGSKLYKFCHQDLLSMRNGEMNFPALPTFQPKGSEWMTPNQEWVTWIYGWTSVAFCGLIVLSILNRVLKSVVKLFRGSYKPTGRDMNINFSDVPSINAYIPEVRSATYAYPLLACNTDGLDEGLLNWRDPDRPFDYYNLTKDAEEIFRGASHKPHKYAFSVIKHWPPSDEEEIFGADGESMAVSMITQNTAY